MCKSVLISLAFLAVISVALGQTATQQTCVQATSLSFDNAAYNGTWYEVARNPAPAVGCITLDVNVQSQYVQVNVSHSISTTNLQTESRESANITLSTGSNGYNVSFVENQQTTYKFVKVLQLINNTYLVGCTYTNASDASTSAGFILAKFGFNYTLTEKVNNDAATQFTNFQAGVVNNVTQTGCFANSAGQTLPMITLFLTIALLLIKA
ncbi:hypothetical protein KR074_008557 [Drosophila pseudoananassae]|nr:hypothetical protein KR074_008557 [Drosophila pseudoananassae]